MQTGATPRARGFTLVELLIVVAIIAIIAALLIPNFLDALQKSNQKHTMADAHVVGTAMMSWLTDQASAAAAGAAATVDLGDWSGMSDFAAIRAELVPYYATDIPRTDGWRRDYLYRLDFDLVNPRQLFLIASGGRDGNVPSGVYTVGTFDSTDYDQDIIWADGFFVRWPEK